jgi:cytochrome b561
MLCYREVRPTRAGRGKMAPIVQLLEIPMSAFRYARSQIAVHWLAALAIIFLLLTGTFVLSELPNEASKVGNLRIHLIVGLLAAALVVSRIMMRRRLPAPPPVAFERLAHAGHVALNVTVLLLAASGAGLMVQSGALDAVFGSGTLPPDFTVFALRKVHGLLSRLAMGLVGLHVVAALYHQIVLRDRLLGRVGLGRS